MLMSSKGVKEGEVWDKGVILTWDRGIWFYLSTNGT